MTMQSWSATGPNGETRAVGVQGQQVWAGPVHVGVLSARFGELPDGGEGVRARLQLTTTDEQQFVTVVAGDVVKIGEQGTLTIKAVEPPQASSLIDPPGLQNPDRGLVALEFHPAERTSSST